jgi:hypothetical protein
VELSPAIEMRWVSAVSDTTLISCGRTPTSGVEGRRYGAIALDDLAAFLRYMLVHLHHPRASHESLTVQTGTLKPVRGLFWHTAPGTDPADDIWVHYGFTGTAMWISPRALLTKLYYTRDRQPLTDVRNTFRALAFGQP